MVWCAILLFLSIFVAPSLTQVTSISSFTAEQTRASLRITLTLVNSIEAESGCFFDKLVFLGEPTGDGFTPQYPGMCDLRDGSTLVGTMDVRDYIHFIPLRSFMGLQSSYITIRGESQSPVDFIPGVMVIPPSQPLQATQFTPLTTTPSLVSFDVDLSTREILMHFDSILDPTSVSLNRLNFNNGTTPTQTTVSAVLTNTQLLTTTLCIVIADSVITLFRETGICQSASSCFCTYPEGFVADYNGNLAASGSVQVSLLRGSRPIDLPVSMRLSLSYLNCNVTHTLGEDEVFVVRPFERVLRVECSTNTAANQSNIQPQLTRGSSFSSSNDVAIDDYVVFNWPTSVSLDFSNGFPSQLYGQYLCRSQIGYYVRNYIHDNNSNIELLDGSSYRLPVYNSLTISLYFGHYPHVNLSQPATEIALFNTATGSAIQTEPSYERVNSYHVNLMFPMAQMLLSGNYEIRISVRNVRVATQFITIEVTAPVLVLWPEVAAVLPGQDDILLTCTTNSDNLQVRWLSETGSLLATDTSLGVSLPSEGHSYNCSIIDPVIDSILISASVPLIEVEDNLTVLHHEISGLQPIMNNSRVEVINRFSSLRLQCVEYARAMVASPTWFVLPTNGSLVVPSSGKDGDTYITTASGNMAFLTVDNSIVPFRGLLKCFSSSGEVININVVSDDEEQLQTCEAEMDSYWEIPWAETIAGNRDFQPCPGALANGFVLRQCGDDGKWNGTIDVSSCSSGAFNDLREETLFSLIDAYNKVELNAEVTRFIHQLNITTQPKMVTHFPRDLETVSSLVEMLIELLADTPLPSIHTELVGVLDNLLHVNNMQGWDLLRDDQGSQRLLNITEDFGLYLMHSLNNESSILTLEGANIEYRAIFIAGYDRDLIYPADLSKEARIFLSSALLTQIQPTSAVHLIIDNLNTFLPAPESESVDSMLTVVSRIFSTQIEAASGLVTSFGDQNVTIQFTTKEAVRATNPVCLFWDIGVSQGQWSSAGINSILLNATGRENKQFTVNCSSDHLTAFAVAVSSDTSDFNFSIPVYVGCGFVIFSSVLSIFSLLLSCICDGLRRYSLVAYLIHLSFVASVLCAFISFLAGVEQAVNHRVGCVAVAGLLHYFFTAAFSWLLMEGILLVFFQSFSQYCGLFVLIFIVGWGLPAIPTAIALGILHESYGAAQHCWFFFDGVVSDEVVLGFLIPKFIIIGLTIFLLLISCCTNYKFSNRKIQPYLKTNITRILWMTWGSIFLFLIFLSASWVFALLLVNVYGIDSAILGWVYMIATIILGVWMFIFSVTIMVVNQKIDYDRVWNSPDPVYPSSDPGRGKGYQFTNMSSLVDLSGRRTSTLTRPPAAHANPTFEIEKN